MAKKAPPPPDDGRLLGNKTNTDYGHCHATKSVMDEEAARDRYPERVGSAHRVDASASAAHALPAAERTFEAGNGNGGAGNGETTNEGIEPRMSTSSASSGTLGDQLPGASYRSQVITEEEASEIVEAILATNPSAKPGITAEYGPILRVWKQEEDLPITLQTLANRLRRGGHQLQWDQHTAPCLRHHH